MLALVSVTTPRMVVGFCDHTPSHLMNFVLNEEVDQRYQGAKEQAGKDLPVSDGRCIRRTQR